jgi:hypothetical protein
LPDIPNAIQVSMVHKEDWVIDGGPNVQHLKS